MTDPNAPENSGQTGDAVPPVPPAPPAYDASPYVAPPAPSYDTTPYPPAAEAPTYGAPTYGAPTYGAPAYGASNYGASGYGAQPVQTTPGAPPVMPYGYGGYAPARRTNGLAVASMILSIVGFIWVLPFVGSIAGAIMGHISLGQIRRTGEAGRGMALAGVIVGWAGLALLVLGVLFFVFIAAVSSTSRYA